MIYYGIEMPTTFDQLPSDVVDMIVEERVREWKAAGLLDPHCPHCGEPGHTVICDDCYKELGAGG